MPTEAPAKRYLLRLYNADRTDETAALPLIASASEPPPIQINLLSQERGEFTRMPLTRSVASSVEGRPTLLSINQQKNSGGLETRLWPCDPILRIEHSKEVPGWL